MVDFVVSIVVTYIRTENQQHNKQGPVSFVDQNQGLVNDIRKTVGLDPSENYTAIRQKLDE